MSSTKNPARGGAFHYCCCIAYLLRPEPGPVGVNVDPLGWSVLPEGFTLELEPVVRPTVEPGALPTEDPPTVEPLPEVPVAEEPAEVPPDIPPPAAPPLL